MKHATEKARHHSRLHFARVAVAALNHSHRRLTDREDISRLEKIGGVGPKNVDRIIKGAEQMGTQGQNPTSVTDAELGVCG